MDYGASANQAILNAFSYKLKGMAYENFMNDASQHTCKATWQREEEC